MVRRWSRVTGIPNSSKYNLNHAVGYSQAINLYLIYDFWKTSDLTATPFRRRLVTRKYYSGQITRVAQLHFWSLDYRFSKLTTTHLSNLFFFKKNLSSYNFLKTTKFKTSQHQISELSKLSSLTFNLHKKLYNGTSGKKFEMLALSLYRTNRHLKLSDSTTTPLRLTTPQVVYKATLKLPYYENLWYSNLNAILTRSTLNFVKPYYTVMGLITLHKTFKYNFEKY